MKKIVWMTLLSILISSCKPPKNDTDTVGKVSGGDIRRFENNEVICYIYKGYKKGGISCYFKHIVKIKDNSALVGEDENNSNNCGVTILDK